MTMLQAALISLMAYLVAEAVPWLIGDFGGYYIFSKPLVSGLIVGIILNDIPTGILIGAAVQTVYLANIAVGGQIQTDIAVVAYPAVALGVVSGATPEIAIAIAATLGILGVMGWNVMGVINIFWNTRADRAVERCDYKGIIMNSVAGPQLTTFILRFVPSFLVLYFGAEYVGQITTWAPALLMDTLGVVGGVLPAAGIAMILSMLVHEGSDWVYLIAGFMMVVYLGLGLVPVAIIGVIAAVIIYKNSLTKISDKGDDMEVTL